MKRRELSALLLAGAAGSAMAPNAARAQTCTLPCYPRTAAEIAAGVTPSNFEFESHDHSGYVHVRRYGAKGDGVTDDTVAIQNAISVAQASGRNLSVFLGDGYFPVSSSLVIATANQGISIIGNHWSSEQQGSHLPSCAIKWTGGASPVFSITTTFTSFYNFAIHNFGSGTAALRLTSGGRMHCYRMSLTVPSGASIWSTAAIDADSLNYSYVERCEFESAPALRLRGAVATTCEITKCIFDCIGASTSTAALDVDAAFDKLYVHGNTFNFQSTSRLAFDNSASSNNVRTIIFFANEFDGNANAFQQYIGRFKNVQFLNFQSNDVQQFGSSSASLIQLTNSRAYALMNYGVSIGAALIETTDSTSYVYAGPNFLVANSTVGVTKTSSRSGNRIPVAPSGGAARIHGELVSSDSKAVFSITATATTAFQIQLAFPTDGDAGCMSPGQVYVVLVRNASGGALAGVTFDSTFKTSGAFTAPPTGFSRSIEFVYDGTNSVELSRSTANVSN